MLKNILFLKVFLLLMTELFGQGAAIKYEEKKVIYLKDDTAIVNQLNKDAEKIQFSDPVKAIKIINKSIFTAQKINY